MSKDLSLYGITEELENFNKLLEMDSGEFSEDAEALLVEIEETLANKTDSVVGYYKKEMNLIETLAEKERQAKAIASDYKKAQEVRTNKLKRFEGYVKDCLEKTNRENFKGILNIIKLRKPTKVLLIEDEKSIPVQYLVTTTTTSIDKKAIKDDLKRGAIIDGASLVNGKISVILGLNK